MSFEIVIGLSVHDEAGYTAYRAAIASLLSTCGGHFRYDFRIAEVLKSESEIPINRVFVLAFPDEEAKIRFFNDESYKQINQRLFQTSVDGTVSIARYTIP